MDAGPQKATPETTRMVWIDYARGLGVILVVYGHVLGGLVRPGIFPDGALARWMDYTLYTFHMPLFFFLAGLNVQHSLRKGARPFLESKLWTIAYPYVLWSLIQGGTTMLLARDANIPIYPSDLAAIWFRPIAQFWFLYALMICHLVAVFVPSRAVLVSLAVAGFAVFLMLPIRPDLALTLHHLPFYVAGLYGARSMAEWRPQGWSLLIAIGAAFAVAVALGGHLSGMDANGLASLPACVLGIAGTVLFCRLLDPAHHRWLAAVGIASMTIYVLHILAGSGMRIIMLKAHVPAWPWLYLLAGTAAGVVLPLIAHAALRRLHLLTVFGLAAPGRRKPQPVPIAPRVATSDQAPV
ncbi:acyltransferase [Bradyrhizobium sp. 83012]|uniref:Acyltransferase n=1 Tax=Bradyrhizobium aeschynomenes TaxID=2734909 RepID=A0ABX2C8I1_9BRAD|nr:acyltransferase [Bradyrhizobium aeschynomenes]NPU10071.1 acyltransferase [Bradyrhizobium aeschynomenes]NPU63612.1 acyltransferase [Bradyrhizobium aeschynomenes]